VQIAIRWTPKVRFITIGVYLLPTFRTRTTAGIFRCVQHQGSRRGRVHYTIAPLEILSLWRNLVKRRMTLGTNRGTPGHKPGVKHRAGRLPGASAALVECGFSITGFVKVGGVCYSPASARGSFPPHTRFSYQAG
jgi:hypothetical protein